jgi:hypothetical protein
VFLWEIIHLNITDEIKILNWGTLNSGFYCTVKLKTGHM